VIVDLYQGCYQGQPLDPGDRILSFDAKPQINARHRLHPALPTAPLARPRRSAHCPTASPTWTSSGSSDVTAQEA
jgi:hypothetical protein